MELLEAVQSGSWGGIRGCMPHDSLPLPLPLIRLQLVALLLALQIFVVLPPHVKCVSLLCRMLHGLRHCIPEKVVPVLKAPHP